MKQLKQSKKLKQLINLDRFPTFADEDYVWINDDSCLKERDFYPPLDDRVLKSNVKDIEGGDNFADYCKYIFEILDEEEYWDD